MYSGFNLTMQGFHFDRPSDNVEFQAKGKRLVAAQQQLVKLELDRYLQPDGSIDAARVEDDWFPTINAHIFLSHSHADIEQVELFAAWLQDRGLSAFVDSAVWKYADELLKLIDNRFCLEGDNTYLYELRNRSTAHVHNILLVALMKMVDKTECTILLNTPNSIQVSDAISKDANAVTKSPWIYSELAFSRMVRRRSKAQHRAGALQGRIAFGKAAESPVISYPAPLDHLVNINFPILQDCFTGAGAAASKLDALYTRMGISDGINAN